MKPVPSAILYAVDLKKQVLYSMCWEDHELVHSLVSQGDRVAMVCSAGELVLTALSKQPHSIIAVDSNLDQLRLAELKLAAVRRFNPSTFATLLGLHTLRGEQKTDRLALMDDLQASIGTDQSEWITKQKALLSDGWIHIGRFERYLQQFSRYFFSIAVRRSTIQAFLKASSLDEQRRIYDKGINTPLYRLFFKFFFGKFYMRKRGRHPDLLAHVRVAPERVFYRRMEHAFCEVPIASNYFLRWIMRGHWEPKETPLAYQSSVREGILRSSITPLFVHNNMPSALQNIEEGALDLVYLSDITETMSQEEAQKLFDAAARVLKQGGKMVLWNNLVERKPVGAWQLDEAASLRFWKDRKVSFYGYLGIFIRT